MIRVRQALAGDLEEMLQIAHGSATAAQWPRKQYEALFAPEASRERIALVIEEASRPCGLLIARIVGNEWEIENVAVQPEARRRGLGSRLLSEFLAGVKNDAGISVYLEVRESNRAARRLYEKWGFSEAGKRKNYYQDPPEDALILKISFPGPSRI